MKIYKNLSFIFIGLLTAHSCMSLNDAIPTVPEKTGTPNNSHVIPPKNIIEAMHTENNATIAHNQPAQETKQITNQDTTTHATDNSPNKIVDSISLGQLPNSDTIQSQDSSASKSTPINSIQMTITKLIPLLTKYINKIDGLTSDDIQTLQRLFKSSYSQTYHPNSFDPISMGRFNKTKDYVSLLQNTKFPNTPPFILEQYVDLVLAATKSGQKGWIGTWPTLTPADVLNYKPGWPEKDSDHDTLISTPTDLQILFHDMQAIEKAINMDIASKSRITRKIIEMKKGIINPPTIETEKITFNSFDKKGFPTDDEIKSLIIKQYFPNKKNDDITVSIVNGGGYTDNIYSVSFQNKPVFFLKISNGKDSDKNLVDLQKSFVGRLGMQSRYESTLNSDLQKNLPIVTWMEKLYTYKDENNKKRTIEVMHAAKGKSIYRIMTESTSTKSIISAFNATGKALGSFQQCFMNYNNSNDPATWTTVAHGDYHIGNIFFDPSKSQIYLIDNETMSPDTLKTSNSVKLYKGMHEDFKFFILFVGNRIFKGKDTYRGISTASMYSSFSDGYFNTFPADKRSILAQYLKENSGLNPQYFDRYIIPATQPEAPTINQPTTGIAKQNQVAQPKGNPAPQVNQPAIAA